MWEIYNISELEKIADDVIILKTSGIPLFSRYYGGKICK